MALAQKILAMMQSCREKLKRKSKHTCYAQCIPPAPNHTIHEMMWKNMVQPEMLLNNLNLRTNDAHCLPGNKDNFPNTHSLSHDI